VPKPGVRLNLADLVENLPSGVNLSYIFDINNHGDMIGVDVYGGEYLLVRVDATESAPSTAAAPAPSLSKGNGQQAIPPATSAMLHRYMSRLRPLKSGAALPQGLPDRLLLSVPFLNEMHLGTKQ
jgi:hypothetical protein